MNRVTYLACLAIASLGNFPTLANAQDNESSLAERFAPTVYYPSDEPNWPEPVDRFLTQTTLNAYAADCSPSRVQLSNGPVSEDSLENASFTFPCAGNTITAKTRDADKRHTLYLSDVNAVARGGSTKPDEWPIFFHEYARRSGGTVIQYWFFYPYNTGRAFSIPPPFDIISKTVEFGFHGGDWECAYVFLAADNSLEGLRFTGHAALTDETPGTNISLDGTHPIIYSLWGGHEMSTTPPEPRSYSVRRETFSGGSIAWKDGSHFTSSALLNLGDKTHPLQPWLTYAGLWGSPGVDYSGLLKTAGVSDPFGNISSGYWGPAFNETGLQADGFITAWCFDRKDDELSVGAVRECYS